MERVVRNIIEQSRSNQSEIARVEKAKVFGNERATNREKKNIYLRHIIYNAQFEESLTTWSGPNHSYLHFPFPLPYSSRFVLPPALQCLPTEGCLVTLLHGRCLFL